ncbi:MAG: C39 family peptidase [Patescibacteria group bacterium]
MILKSLLSNPFDGEKTSWKPWYGFLFLFVLAVSFGLYVYQRVHGGPLVPTSTVPSVVYQNAKIANEHQQELTTITEEAAVSNVLLSDVAKAALDIIAPQLPESVDLAVPFLVQCQSGVWDEAHANASEEASLFMVHEFLVPSAPIDFVDAIIASEKERGLPPQFSSIEFASFIESYDQSLNATVIEDPTIEEIKTYLYQGTPVLVPTNGDVLQNPFFIAEGLPQHWIVLRGYDSKNFFVNDPGTRRGEKYVYTQEIVMSAMLENRVVIVELK